MLAPALAAVVLGLAGEAVEPCRSSDLAGRLSLQGATGALVGPLVLRNVGRSSCTLPERPRLLLRAAVVSQVSMRVPEGLRSRAPRRYPIVVDPGERAAAWIHWSNWCGPRRPLWLRVVLSSVRSVWLHAPDQPRCDRPSARSQIGVAPFVHWR